MGLSEYICRLVYIIKIHLIKYFLNMAIKQITRNCFVSYHHDYDQEYLAKLRKIIKKMKVSDFSLKDDIGHYTDETIYKKIRRKMYNCSVTVILVGEKTGHRKWIDWEIWASLRSYKHPYDPQKSFRPNGLLAVFLPSNSYSIPDRLQDNIDSGYVVCMDWEDLETEFQEKVELAYKNRNSAKSRIRNKREKIDRNYLSLLGFRI